MEARVTSLVRTPEVAFRSNDMASSETPTVPAPGAGENEVLNCASWIRCGIVPDLSFVRLMWREPALNQERPERRLNRALLVIASLAGRLKSLRKSGSVTSSAVAESM